MTAEITDIRFGLLFIIGELKYSLGAVPQKNPHCGIIGSWGNTKFYENRKGAHNEQ